MMGQTESLVPADRLIYALRDVTATVESLPLIVSSILSKKLAESLDGLVLDVKYGSGAFMRTPEEARLLARTLVNVAGRQGVETVALLTRMDEPLGRTIGHALEMEESAAFLREGCGEAGLHEVCLELACWMVHLGSHRKLSLDEARDACQSELKSPRPFALFQQMLGAQGGDWERFERERTTERATLPCFTLRAPANGYLHALEPRALGGLLTALGGGRSRTESSIDFGVGIEVEKKVGDAISAGEPILRVFYRDPRHLPALQTTLIGAVEIGPEVVKPQRWILECLQ
jgi:thymidine phosphorylase